MSYPTKCRDRDALAEIILNNFHPPKWGGSSWTLSPHRAADDILASDALTRVISDAKAEVAATVEALCAEAEAGEGIVITPGFTTLYAVEVSHLRAALADALDGAA